MTVHSIEVDNHDGNHFTCLTIRMDELSKRVEENKNTCTHSKNNLEHTIRFVEEQVRNTYSMYKGIKDATESAAKNAEKTDSKLGELNNKVTASAQIHQNNSDLIKWILGLFAILVGATFAAILTFVLTNVIK